MARTQSRPKRKVSGGRYISYRGKKNQELAGFPAQTKLGEKRVRQIRTIGAHQKLSLLAINKVNVAQKGKTVVTEIVNVIENPANPNLVRRNILTKGAVVETKLGKVRITSRPGQEGAVNGVLI
ncbi:MAG TPA: 30S ribosomal protein S8e [Candidatus Nanoarchaeia archaeon]|nr:30S ribosomal protein S8e [Candidatus Nanoarchaeia archaeon]